MTLSPSEKAELARENAQCLLLNNLTKIQRLAGLTQYPIKRAAENLPNEGNNVYGKRTGIISYLGDPDSLVNALTQDKENISTFVHATHAQLSLLQPKLDFFIRTNTVDPNTNQVTPVDRPIHFSDFTKGETVKKLGRIREGREEVLHPRDGLNVGVTEFSWDFDNKHEGDRVIKARLKLYFGSLAELTSQYYLDFLFADGKRSVYQPTTESTYDKIRKLETSLRDREEKVKLGKPAGRERSNRLRDSQQLKVAVGWQRPSRDVPELFANKKEQIRFYDAIDAFQKVLLLNITQYDLSFNQNGSVEVTIEYIASTDAVLVSPETDVLGNPQEFGFVPLETFGFIEGLLNPSDSMRADMTSRGYKGTDVVQAFKPLYTAHRMVSAIRSGNNAGAEGVVFPEELGGNQAAFKVSIDALKAELEYLNEWLDLYDLKGANKPNASKSGNAKQRKKVKQQYDAVADALEAALTQAKRTKYATFLKNLLEGYRVFRAEATFQDVEGNARQGSPPRYLSIKSPQRSHLHDDFYGSDFLSKKMDRLARVGTETDTAVDEEDLYKILDPSRTYSEYGTTTPPAAGTARVLYFIRLGDIVQIAAANAGISLENQIVFGSFSPSLAKIPFNPGGLASLAELPISIDYFGQWFYDHVITRDLTQYAFRRFLDDILNGLVSPLINAMCSESRNFAMGYTLYTLDAKTFIDKTASSFVEKKSILNGQSFTVRNNEADMFLNATRDAAKKALSSVSNQLITLILIHSEQVNEERTGNLQQDEEDGIYHFVIGTDRGIAQEFNFQKKQMPQLRAMNIEKVNNGASKAGILVLPMDVSITMFGNGLLRNGSMIFVNADYGLGQRVADSLALGGYYRVYKSSNSIEPGGYSTTVDCIFERPRNFPNG